MRQELTLRCCLQVLTSRVSRGMTYRDKLFTHTSFTGSVGKKVLPCTVVFIWEWLQPLQGYPYYILGKNTSPFDRISMLDHSKIWIYINSSGNIWTTVINRMPFYQCSILTEHVEETIYMGWRPTGRAIHTEYLASIGHNWNQQTSHISIWLHGWGWVKHKNKMCDLFWNSFTVEPRTGV